MADGGGGDCGSSFYSDKPRSVERGTGILGNNSNAIQPPPVPLLDDDYNIHSRVGSWEFNPYKELAEGDFLIGGDLYATVGKNSLMQHHVALPPDAMGIISWIAPAGRYSLKNNVLELEFQGVKKSFTIEDALDGKVEGSRGAGNDSESEAGFAKLVGENFEYVMQTYSITLGRRSDESDDIIDLSSVGGGLNISRIHAKIEYDFEDRCFFLEVIGKNGLFIQGHLLRPAGNAPLRVPLQSRDFIQIGDVDFYFLLPVESTI